MSNKYVDFVSDDYFLDCVRLVCEAYPRTSNEVDMKKLVKNSLDPFKMIFDIFSGDICVDEWIKNEERRQNDKTINNRIGVFHQKLLGGVKGWEDLGVGHPLGIDLKRSDNSIFIELKNKHNTVKGENHKDVFDKLMKVLNQHKKSKVYYAYIIPKKPSSGERVWKPSRRNPNPHILEAWGSRVYEIVTGDKNSLKKTWMALPLAISEIEKTRIKNRLSEEDLNKLVGFFNSTLQD